MRPAAYRYRLHADLPVKFHCGGEVWQLQKRPAAQADELHCELVGPNRYTVTTATDEQGLRQQLRQHGVELHPSTYACTLFLHLEQLGLAQRVHPENANAA